MEKETFDKIMEQHAVKLQQIRQAAHKLHASVNQYYDGSKPYSVHLDSVADYVKQYGAEICASADDVVPMIFGAYFHDSIEDARLTYNNVMRIAQSMMDERQALIATEIVYALTNEKGRTRAQRANDLYYQGIRSTPYAPLCKFADRLANVTYSVTQGTTKPKSMRDVYASENAHFVNAITTGLTTDDPRLRVPVAMIETLEDVLSPKS